MTRRVFLHVGAPKTGTTYLQDLLARNVRAVADRGLLYPETASGSHFEAAIDLQDLRWGGQLAGARGSWDALAGAVRRASRDALISHEVLAAATPAHVARARTSLADAEVHVVVTMRDLARQIPAEWQETVKHRGRMRYAKFVRDLQKAPRTDSDLWFWRVQSLPDVLTRWGQDLPPERLHVVTVPRSGADPSTLWNRFSGVLGLPADLVLEQPERANESMGVAETALIRRLNVALRGRRIPQPVYAATVRDLMVHQTLAALDLSERASVPPRVRPFVDQVTDEWLEWLDGSGVDVVGDPAELRPVWPDAAEWTDPDEADPEAVIDAAVAAIAELVVRDADRFRATSAPVKGLRRLKDALTKETRGR